MITFITTRDQLNWSIGQPFPQLVGFDTVKEVRADGEELGIILNWFKNIPQAFTSSSEVWKEPWAQFIFDNFPQLIKK